MKLTSKEICPVTVRDRLIKIFSNQDVYDLVEAVKWAEAKCLELDKENEELEQYVARAKNLIRELNSDIKGYQEIVNTKEVQKIINNQS